MTAQGAAPAEKPAAISAARTIEAAQKLLLQKHRQEAIEKLVLLLGSGNLRPADRKAVQEALEQVATRVLTDKGQRLFELAQTQLYVNPRQALARLAEVRELEFGNLAVELAAARAQLLLEACDEALKTVEAIETGGLRNSESAELLVSAELCAENFTDLQETLNKRTQDLHSTIVIYKIALARLKAHEGAGDKALEILREALSSDPGAPGALYWYWKISQSLGKDAEDKASRYVGLCKAPTPQLRRKYLNSPEICLRFGEVEAYLKARPTDTGDNNP